MQPIKLPPVDPDILLILAIVGAVAGAIATVGGYLATKVAEVIGEKIEIIPQPPEAE